MVNLTTTLSLFLLSLTLVSANEKSYSDWDDFKEVTLKTHNKARSEHGVPPLKWEGDLATFAENVVKGCVMKHSGGPYGENLTMGAESASESIQMWVNERGKYKYATGGFSGDTGHFTQVVWKGSKTVGCHRKKCGGSWLVACEYKPPGNYEGKFQENVFPKR